MVYNASSADLSITPTTNATNITDTGIDVVDRSQPHNHKHKSVPTKRTLATLLLYILLTILLTKALRMSASAAATGAANGARKLRVDITSDTICPFCILGVRQLQVAAENYKKTHPSAPELDVHFHPFQLGGGGKFTEKPVNRREYMANNYGAERSQAFAQNFDRQYKALGLGGFASDAQLASSHLGHRLTAYAEDKKPEEAAGVALDLMKNYQVDGHSPSDRDRLAQIAVSHGLFPTEQAAKDWLNGNEKDAEVREQYKDAVDSGITGVPFFVFDKKYATSGAVGEDQFENILDQVIKKENL